MSQSEKANQTEQTNKPGKAKKILSIIGNILLYIFLIACIITLVLAVTSKKDSDGTVELFGMQMRIVISSSMEACDQTDVSGYQIKSIPIRSMVFIQTVPDDETAAEEWYGSLKVGDVLTFKYVYSNQVVITHRIASITPKESGGYIIELRGDNRNDDSGQLDQTIDTSLTDSPNYVIGKVTGVSRVLGFLVSAFNPKINSDATWVIVFVIIVPCAIIMVFEIVKIVGVLSGNKREQRQKESAQKDAEMEELKRRLAELEGRGGAPADGTPPTAEEASNTSSENAESASNSAEDSQPNAAETDTETATVAPQNAAKEEPAENAPQTSSNEAEIEHTPAVTPNSSDESAPENTTEKAASNAAENPQPDAPKDPE